MSVVAAQTKHPYPVVASFQGYNEGYSNVLAPIPLGLSFRTDFLGKLEAPLEKDVP